MDQLLEMPRSNTFQPRGRAATVSVDARIRGGTTTTAVCHRPLSFQLRGQKNQIIYGKDPFLSCTFAVVLLYVHEVAAKAQDVAQNVHLVGRDVLS